MSSSDSSSSDSELPYNSNNFDSSSDDSDQEGVEFNRIEVEKETASFSLKKRKRNEILDHSDQDDTPKRKKKRPNKKKQDEDAIISGMTEEEKAKAKSLERGEGLSLANIKDKKLKGNLQRERRRTKLAVKDVVKAQVLLTEEVGYLEPEGMEETHLFSQRDLLEHVDLQTASKMFDLVLDELGPYKIDYSFNGKHLLLCGRRGHVAMLDWTTKQLVTELFLNETCKDVK